MNSMAFSTTLNAMQDIFSRDYPKGDFLAKQGPRGVVDSRASDTDDPTVDPRFGKSRKTGHY